MTNYRTSNESQREDRELYKAIKKELEELIGIVRTIQMKLWAAQDHIREGIELEELDLGSSSPLRQTLYHVVEANRSLDYMIAGNPGETYIKTIAAYMTPETAEELKEKHRG